MLALASLVLFALSIGVPLGAAVASPTDEETITAQVMAFAAAWDKHDAKAMAALWAEDGDLVNPFGEIAKSRAEVEQLFADQHAGTMKGTTYAVSMRSVRMVAPGVAVATWDGVINGMTAEDGPFPPFDHLVTVGGEEGRDLADGRGAGHGAGAGAAASRAGGHGQAHPCPDPPSPARAVFAAGHSAPPPWRAAASGRRSSASASPLAPASARLVEYHEVRSPTGTSCARWRRLRPDRVLHLAALTFGRPAGPVDQRFLDVNVQGTRVVCEALLAAGLRPRVLVTSSSGVYGAAREDPITEAAPLRPQTLYAASKACQELVALAYHHSHGLEVVVTRAFNHTGPGEHPHFAASTFARQIARRGQAAEAAARQEPRASAISPTCVTSPAATWRARGGSRTATTSARRGAAVRHPHPSGYPVPVRAGATRRAWPRRAVPAEATTASPPPPLGPNPLATTSPTRQRSGRRPPPGVSEERLQEQKRWNGDRPVLLTGAGGHQPPGRELVGRRPACAPSCATTRAARAAIDDFPPQVKSGRGGDR
jgi:uncharacterized protein (TIGR02246 family)